jgi:uncharacterized integral membrane protein (TIGR00698 family)
MQTGEPSPTSEAALRSTAALPAAALVIGAVLSLSLFSAPVALVCGAAIALTLGNPVAAWTHRWTHRLLPLAVVGLGAGMNLGTVARVGLHGLGYTAVSLALVLGMGLALGRWLRVDRETGLLIGVGTAICGGSAIAAAAPVLHARPHQVSVALATVFLLNALALLVFPPLGHLAGLGQEPFGLWAALAIHDTSSVVGAGLAYGPRALEVATTVKLARALWIVPVTLGLGLWTERSRGSDDAEGANAGGAQRASVKKPWFIVGFVAVAAAVTWLPSLHAAGQWVAAAAHRVLVLTLFLVGAGLSREALRSVGIRPFLQGILLWAMIGSVGLIAVKLGLLSVM